MVPFEEHATQLSAQSMHSKSSTSYSTADLHRSGGVGLAAVNGVDLLNGQRDSCCRAQAFSGVEVCSRVHAFGWPAQAPILVQ